MNPALYFAYRQRKRLNGEDVYSNPFAPWTVEDLYPELLLEDDWEPAGFLESIDEAGEEWLVSLMESPWPLLFLIEQCCDQAELLPRQIRECRLAKFPLEAVFACEEAIAAADPEWADDVFGVTSQAVRIERARRRGGAP